MLYSLQITSKTERYITFSVSVAKNNFSVFLAEVHMFNVATTFTIYVMSLLTAYHILRFIIVDSITTYYFLYNELREFIPDN